MLQRVSPSLPLSDLRAEVQQAAQAAALTYCSDEGAGITRRRSGTGFSYRDDKGRLVRDSIELARIRSIAIPPAWTDVWIAPSPTCHIQATGRDARGRKQYRYHARWAECRDEVKFGSLAAFGRAIPAIRRKVEEDLSRRGLPRERVIATVVWLLDNVMIRVGNLGYARQNRSFGLTTLRNRHVEIDGSTLRFAFRGKSGKEWNLRVTDRRIARIVKTAQDLPGQHLFQYVDGDGTRRSVASHDVNAYLRESGAEGFTSKHFRTWGGTVIAADELGRTPCPAAKREAAMTLNAVIDRVAAKLGNTRTVCRNCYIHPLVIDSWLDGKLTGELSAIRARGGRTPRWLDREEAVLLGWLESRGQG